MRVIRATGLRSMTALVALASLAGPVRADEPKRDPRPAAADEVAVREADAALEAVGRAAIEKVAPSVVEVETLGAMPEKVGEPPAEGSGGTADGVIARKGFKQAFGPSTGLAVGKELVLTSSFALAREPRHIFVTRHDGKSFVAKPLGRDESRQLVLLSVPGADLTPAPAAPRASIKVGRQAIAVGRGLGVPSVSVGLVSAIDRCSGKAIQSSAMISPVNYGGPLVSIDGEVLGILAPLAAAGGMAGIDLYDSGIGFAVPLVDVLPLLPRLEKGEKLLPGFLGIGVDQGRTEDGVLVEGVQPGSPAEKAGLQAKDVIVSVDGQPVAASYQLHHALGRRSAGDVVKLVVERGGKKVSLEATLGAPPPPPAPRPRLPGGPGGPGGPKGPGGPGGPGKPQDEDDTH